MYKVQIKRDILGTISLFNWENVKIIMGDMNWGREEGRLKEEKKKEEKKKERRRRKEGNKGGKMEERMREKVEKKEAGAYSEWEGEGGEKRR